MQQETSKRRFFNALKVNFMYKLRGLSLSLVLFCTWVNLKAQIHCEATNQLLGQLIGLYNNKAQSDTSNSPLYQPQETRIFRIMEGQKDQYWLYWGWFAAGLNGRALEERILHIKDYQAGVWELEVYLVPEKYRHASVWREPKPLYKLKPKDLILERCQAKIEPKGPQAYQLSSSPCQALGNLSGHANFFTVDINIEAERLISNTVFLDNQKNPVFANQNSTYECVSRKDFERPFHIGKETPTH